jgi:hypothetical protein
MIRLHFIKGEGVGDKLIQTVTWSDWSHVALEINGRIYEATLNGVRTVSLEDFLRYYDEKKITHKAYRLHGLDEAKVWNRAIGELNKPYDYTTLITHYFKIDYTERDKWMCSEYAGYCIQELIPHDKYYKLNPRHLHLIAHAVEKSNA